MPLLKVVLRSLSKMETLNVEKLAFDAITRKITVTDHNRLAIPPGSLRVI